MTALFLVLLLLLAGGLGPVTALTPPPDAVEVGERSHTFHDRDHPGIRDIVDGKAVLLPSVQAYVDWVSTLPADIREPIALEIDPTYDDHFLVAATQLWCAQDTRLLYEADTHLLVYEVVHEPDVVCEVDPGIEVFTVRDDEVRVHPEHLTIRTRTEEGPR